MSAIVCHVLNKSPYEAVYGANLLHLIAFLPETAAYSY